MRAVAAMFDLTIDQARAQARRLGPALQPQRRQGLTDADPAAGRAFGAYVHIPFCAVRCDYCAFATWTDRAHLIGDYLAAVRTEIIAGAGRWPGRRVTSVFFGGGTPSHGARLPV